MIVLWVFELLSCGVHKLDVYLLQCSVLIISCQCGSRPNGVITLLRCSQIDLACRGNLCDRSKVKVQGHGLSQPGTTNPDINHIF